jgi:hypothetical protein
MLIWYAQYIRHGFVPVTVKKLRQLNLEFIVPGDGRKVILAKLIPEQCASVSFIVGVMGIRECTAELIGHASSPKAAGR